MVRCAALLLASSLSGATGVTLLTRSSSSIRKDRPVMKVVRLMQDMQAELEHELADDKAVHEKLGCWCKENEEEKSKAIALAEAKEAELQSFLAEAAAKMQELTARRNEALAEVDRNFDALQKAQALRMKESKAFHDEEVDLQEASQACGQAIVVLKEYHASPTDLAQVRTVAQRLQQAQVLDLAKRSANAPEDAQLRVLQSFLSQSQSPSFLSVPAGGRYASYAPQGGEIFGILQQMKEEFDQDLQTAQAKEKQAIVEFLDIKTAKEAEIKAGRTLVAKLDGEVADLKVRHAEAFEELENTQAQLALDRKFMFNLKKKCSESAAEFEVRVKDRMEEIAAVADTISILNTDAAFENFGNTVDTAFLQTGLQTVVQDTQDKQQRLRRVASLLQKAAIGLSAPQLSLLAASAQNDAFAKVKEMIDKMIAQLATQQTDESKHRDWCIKDMHLNELSTAEAKDKQESLETRIGDLERSIEYLKKEIEATIAAVKEMGVQMRRASETREGENAAFQETVNDQRMTQIILQKAIARMQEVYSFVQDEPGAPHIQTSGTHTDPGNGPARFNAYEKKSNTGGRVVALLQQVLKDSNTMENDAAAGELNAQSGYEIFMQDSNKAIAAYNKKVIDMKGAVATTQEELGLARGDLKATLHELENLHLELGDLKESCDFILQTFDARQAARSDEIDALRQAKGILSGAS